MPGALILALLAPAFAGGEVDAATAAEVVRLENTMNTLAQKSSWEGVERMYEKLTRLEVPLSTHIHYTAALSAQSQGQIDVAWERLERAVRDEAAVKREKKGKVDYRKTLPTEVSEEDPDLGVAKGALDALRSRYGRVNIVVDGRRLAVLIRLGAKPFSTTEREAIATAQTQLSQKFVFSGPLPVGKYMVDGEMFVVAPGESLEVEVLPR